MMEDKYVCSRCKIAGDKNLVSYKIIRDIDGMSVKFVGQLCNKCYKDLFETNKAPAPSTEEKSNDSSNM